MNVMILAAGEGTRLQPYTQITPKPAIPFLGAPMASYSLAFLDGVDIDNMVVNTYHLPQKIESLFKNISPKCKDLIFSNEKGLLLGSGGGIHKAQAHLEGSGSFIVMNGDEVILPHQPKIMSEMLSFHKWHKGIASLLTLSHPEVGSKFGGAWLGPGTKINCFSKTDPGKPSTRGLHFLGVLILEDRVFDYFHEKVDVENILYETLTKAMQAGEEVHAFEIKAKWFETGNPKDFLRATEFCMKNLNQTDLTHRPYWEEYLLQVIRFYSRPQICVEKDSEFETKLLESIANWKST